ncbi:hypothetical protein [Rhizobium sp. R693]|uniref:hypothetical protein n=1 Tax=Rhizobium sp. R693 TaxID=1764276 RepID=UPI001673FBAC|nr:hypothetical protein [Rhizobium sp. R693]
MDTITDIGKTSLTGVLAALAQAKMKIGSIVDAGGTYTCHLRPRIIFLGRS